jgi:hypothetical protein
MAQQHRLAAFEAIGFDIVLERLPVLEHLAGDRLRPHRRFLHPRPPWRRRIVGVVDEFLAGLRPFDLLQLLHALVEFDALVLQGADQLAFQQIDLLAQDDIRVFENRLDQRNHVERVVRASGSSCGIASSSQRPERLVHREIVLQVDVERHLAGPRVRRRDDPQDVALDQAAEELERAPAQRLLFRRGSWQSRMIARAGRRSRPRARGRAR